MIKLKLKINEVIKEKGYLKKHVAKEMGIDPNTLSRYITGRRRLYLDTAVNLAEILNCTVDDLYEKDR